MIKQIILKLWHMHLRHEGEKALQELVKQGLLKGVKMGKHRFMSIVLFENRQRLSLAP
jgi:hypothetical protein